MNRRYKFEHKQASLHSVWSYEYHTFICKNNQIEVASLSALSLLVLLMGLNSLLVPNVKAQIFLMIADKLHSNFFFL